jgi:hypothetical protein
MKYGWCVDVKNAINKSKLKKKQKHNDCNLTEEAYDCNILNKNCNEYFNILYKCTLSGKADTLPNKN